MTYTYNSEDQLTGITYPESEDEVKGLLFTYDANGWLLQVKVKYASSEAVLREYTYNTDGTVKNMKDHTGSGSSYILKEYTYDARFPIKHILMMPKGMSLQKRTASQAKASSMSTTQRASLSAQRSKTAARL